MKDINFRGKTVEGKWLYGDKELRLGNWLEIKDQEVKTYAQVEGIGNLQHVAGQLWSIEELEPIPLTEEWLERLGFERGGKGESSNYFYIRRDVGADFIAKPNAICYFIFRGNQYLNECTYVHQLQNLHHALTGEELTLIK